MPCNAPSAAAFEANIQTSALVVDGLEVLLGFVRVRHHRLAAWAPSSGTHLSELVGVLEGLHEAQRLVHTASDGQVIDGHLAQILLLVDDEEAAEGNARFLVQHAVRTAHFHRLVRKQGDVHGP